MHLGHVKPGYMSPDLIDPHGDVQPPQMLQCLSHARCQACLALVACGQRNAKTAGLAEACVWSWKIKHPVISYAIKCARTKM